jgi:hypothetical protein
METVVTTLDCDTPKLRLLINGAVKAFIIDSRKIGERHTKAQIRAAALTDPWKTSSDLMQPTGAF